MLFRAEAPTSCSQLINSAATLFAVYMGIEPMPPDRQSGILATGPIDYMQAMKESNLQLGFWRP